MCSSDLDLPPESPAFRSMRRLRLPAAPVSQPPAVEAIERRESNWPQATVAPMMQTLAPVFDRARDLTEAALDQGVPSVQNRFSVQLSMAGKEVPTPESLERMLVEGLRAAARQYGLGEG